MSDIQIQEPVVPTVFSRELSEFESFDETGIKLEELPQPTLWRVLLLPKQAKKMSAGGIALPSTALDAESHLQYIGQVIALGPLAGKSDKYLNPAWKPGHFDKPQWLWDVAVGDWVMYGRYSGLKISYKDATLLMVNDDEIISKIERPDGYKVYI
jgi:co-chaperonin GroES (HSP10)